MRWKYIVNMVLSFVSFTIVATTLSVILAGCSDHQPTRVAWLSVEKAPIKIIYIDKQGELDPVIVEKTFMIVGGTRYRDTAIINENTNVKLEVNSHQSDIESDSDIKSSSLTFAGQ